MSSPFNEDVPPCLVFLCRHGLRWACPMRQDTQGGALFLSLRNLAGRKPNLISRNTVEKGRCHSLSCRAKNSSCRGERVTGSLMLLISSLVREEAAADFSGMEVGIQPMSGESGAQRNSRVVMIGSSLLELFTWIQTMPSSPRTIFSTRT